MFDFSILNKIVRGEVPPEDLPWRKDVTRTPSPETPASDRPRRRQRRITYAPHPPEVPGVKRLQEGESFLGDEEREKFDNTERRRDLFEDKDRYCYWCEFVDRYVDMHGLRGVKDRNIACLEKLRTAGTPEQETELVWELVENNRPLAMRVAMTRFSRSDWSEEDLRDAYGEVLVSLARTYMKHLDDLRKMTIDELQRFNFYVIKGAVDWYSVKLARERSLNGRTTLVHLDEDDASVHAVKEKHVNLDNDFIEQSLKTLKPRDRYIMRTYIWGDPENGIESAFSGPEGSEFLCLAAIAEQMDLSRETCRQTKERCIRKLRKVYHCTHGQERFSSLDDEYEFSIEKHAPGSGNAKPQPPTVKDDVKDEFFEYLKRRR